MKRIKIETAIKRHGGVPGLAKFLGYSRQAVYEWRYRGLEYMPRTAQLEYYWRQANDSRG